MNLVLTSNLPSTSTNAVLASMRSTRPRPRIAWIPPHTEAGHKRFEAARGQFRGLGFDAVDCCDIDRERDEAQLAGLPDYDIIFLSGGDPVRFRRSLYASGVHALLTKAIAAGRLVIAASGGSMLLTNNVSLFRLQSHPLIDVIEQRMNHETLNLVPYEFLPHLNNHPPAFLETVRLYSEQIAHDIVGLVDGGAILHTSSKDYEIVGRAVVFHRGRMREIDTAS
ncbi:MAG: Type 1 glutamine amidotransferase-like domain-containing protein [Pseudomonadota bacterium]